jgi:hypothetical protein
MTVFLSTCGMHPLYPYQYLLIRRHVYLSLVLIYHTTPQQLLLCYANYNCVETEIIRTNLIVIRTESMSAF